MTKIFQIIGILILLAITVKAENPVLLKALKTENQIIKAICYTRSGSAIAVGDGSDIKLFSSDKLELVAQFEGIKGKTIQALDISPDSLLIAACSDSTITIWEVKTAKPKITLEYHKGIVTTVRFSPNSKTLLSGGTDDKIILYELEKDNIIHVFSNHKNHITSVSFSPDGTLIAAVSGDKTLTIYDTESGKLLASRNDPKDWIRELNFSPDGKKVIICADNSRMYEYNITDLASIPDPKIYVEKMDWLTSVEYNEDGHTIATGSISGIVKVTTDFAYFQKDIGTPVNRVLFAPRAGREIKLAIATSGNGVVFLEGKNMNFSQKEQPKSTVCKIHGPQTILKHSCNPILAPQKTNPVD